MTTTTTTTTRDVGVRFSVGPGCVPPPLAFAAVVLYVAVHFLAKWW